MENFASDQPRNSSSARCKIGSGGRVENGTNGIRIRHEKQLRYGIGETIISSGRLTKFFEEYRKLNIGFQR